MKRFVVGRGMRRGGSEIVSDHDTHEEAVRAARQLAGDDYAYTEIVAGSTVLRMIRDMDLIVIIEQGDPNGYRH